MKNVQSLMSFLGAIAFAMGSEAASETFTATSSTTVHSSVMVEQQPGQWHGGYFSTGTWALAWAAEAKSTYSAKCTESVAQPGTAVWNGYATCVLTDRSQGEVITITAHCFLNAATEGNCLGKINIVAGPRLGRSGTITWHDTLINEKSVEPGHVVVGSMIKGTGAGVWYQ